MEAPVDARSFLLTVHNRSKVVRKLPVQGPPRVCNFVTPMQPLDYLLSGERDQNSDHDDPDLPRELAPPMQRLWKVEVHGSARPFGPDLADRQALPVTKFNGPRLRVILSNLLPGGSPVDEIDPPDDLVSDDAIDPEAAPSLPQLFKKAGARRRT